MGGLGDAVGGTGGVGGGGSGGVGGGGGRHRWPARRTPSISVNEVRSELAQVLRINLAILHSFGHYIT